MIPKHYIKQFIQVKAQELGFLHVGFSKARRLDEEETSLTNYLEKQMNGSMSYLENYFDMRLDPQILVPGAKTIISFAFNYFPNETQSEGTYLIAKYAYGKDYHDVVKEKLRSLMETLRQEVGEINGRVFVDSAPVLEKAWARLSGIGWLGKHGLMIRPKQGSFFFLGEIICDLEIEPDEPMKDLCGTCTKCLDACPTNALETPYIVNGSKCISYATIEFKDTTIDPSFEGKMNDWIFGCDICQDVCPWNRFSKPHQEAQFIPHAALLSLSKADWESLEVTKYQELFKGSAVKRTKFSGLTRNIQFAKNT